MRRTRIGDVAAAAGVSTATVSRALSDPARVGAATRARVMEAVRATGYRANGAARDLRARRARSILVLAPDLSNPFFGGIIGAVQEVAAAAGLTVQVADTRRGDAHLDGLGHDGRADGILLLDGGLAPATVAGWTLPVVMLCEWMPGGALPAVGVDNARGARLAAEHLLGLGHRRIAHVAGPEGNVLSAARAAGWRAALEAAGLAPRPGDLLSGGFGLEHGAAAARLWAAAPDRAGAVLCASDECAMGFMSECDRMGLSVPRDVSVTGFDDIELAARTIPPLTTVRQPRAALGRRAAERLVARLLGAADPDGREELPLTLVRRASTAAPPPASA